MATKAAAGRRATLIGPTFAPPHRAERVRAARRAHRPHGSPTSPVIHADTFVAAGAEVPGPPQGRSRPIRFKSDAILAWTAEIARLPPERPRLPPGAGCSRGGSAQPVLVPLDEPPSTRPADRRSSPWLTLAAAWRSRSCPRSGQVGPADRPAHARPRRRGPPWRRGARRTSGPSGDPVRRRSRSAATSTACAACRRCRRDRRGARPGRALRVDLADRDAGGWVVARRRRPRGPLVDRLLHWTAVGSCRCPVAGPGESTFKEPRLAYGIVVVALDLSIPPARTSVIASTSVVVPGTTAVPATYGERPRAWQQQSATRAWRHATRRPPTSA